MGRIIWIIIVAVVELVVPKYISILIAIGNLIFPDTTPFVDEIIGCLIAIKKLSDE